MKQISNKQQQKNRELAQLKAELPKLCKICGLPANDLAHVFPRSTHPQYITEPLNVMILCREHHVRFDDDFRFRHEQWEIIDQARLFATKEEIYRHFGI